MGDNAAQLKKQLKELDTEKRKEIKVVKSRTAKKLQKAELEALEERYAKKEAELKAKYETGAANGDSNNNTGADGAAAVEEVTTKTEQLKVDAGEAAQVPKKSKAQRKKEKQRAKERARELEIEQELANAGPSQKDAEVSQLQQKWLDPQGLKLKEISADGHCLYRAIADQIGTGQAMYKNIRNICADALEENEGEYSPFAEVSTSYEDYIECVRNSAQWGGQLEVRALASALKRQIIVYAVEYSAPVIMGEEFVDEDPIRLSFHRHYYALGEHYNSVVAVEES
uniref:OTU domain-containing protein n=1 Tax=Leptocylindrus danicus TaxID=163516 RepID=A0A7S2JV22_9STRA